MTRMDGSIRLTGIVWLTWFVLLCLDTVRSILRKEGVTVLGCYVLPLIVKNVKSRLVAKSSSVVNAAFVRLDWMLLVRKLIRPFR
jgi:hypothetical protein